jgi:cytosine permease
MIENTDDFVSTVVPTNNRQPWLKVFLVWVGFIVVVGTMAVGGGMAGQMQQSQFVAAVLVGNLLLACFAVLAGYIGAESGKTFNQLMSDVFPHDLSWHIASFYAPIILIGWFGVEAAIFGNLIGEIFNLSPGVRRLVMSLATIMFAVSSYVGFRGLNWVSAVAVPLIYLIGFYAIYLISARSTAKFGFSGTLIGIGEGTAIVMGSWIMGVLTCLPDLTRFCRSRLAGALVGAIGILVGNVFTFMVGGSAAAMAGESDPARLLVSFGFIPLAVILSLANIWTTNDANMYSAALHVARVGEITRRRAVVICTIIAAIFAAFDPTTIGVLFGFLIFMGNTAPALGGVVLGAYLMNRGRSQKLVSVLGGWAGWAAGSFVGAWLGGSWAVPMGFFFGFAVWLAFASLSHERQAVEA